MTMQPSLFADDIEDMDALEPPKIGAVAPWFGSKRNLAPTIVKAIGTHQAYWEPFCGSLAVLLAKPFCAMETVNDLHGDLINLCRVIACEDTAVELFTTLSRFLMHESLFRDAVERVKEWGRAEASEPPSVRRAIDYMVCSWFGRNGVSGTAPYNQGFCARYTKNGGSAAKRWVSAVESIPAWHDRLRAVTILNRDAFAIVQKIEDARGVVIYCDPPYFVKGAKYVHDFSDADHARLAELLRRFRHTRVIVSYYDDPRLNELYPTWGMEKIEVTKALSLQNHKGAKPSKATEVLLTNF